MTLATAFKVLAVALWIAGVLLIVKGRRTYAAWKDGSGTQSGDTREWARALFGKKAQQLPARLNNEAVAALALIVASCVCWLIAWEID